MGCGCSCTSKAIPDDSEDCKDLEYKRLEPAADDRSVLHVAPSSSRAKSSSRSTPAPSGSSAEPSVQRAAPSSKKKPRPFSRKSRSKSVPSKANTNSRWKANRGGRKWWMLRWPFARKRRRQLSQRLTIIVPDDDDDAGYIRPSPSPMHLPISPNATEYLRAPRKRNDDKHNPMHMRRNTLLSSSAPELRSTTSLRGRNRRQSEAAAKPPSLLKRSLRKLASFPMAQRRSPKSAKQRRGIAKRRSKSARHAPLKSPSSASSAGFLRTSLASLARHRPHQLPRTSHSDSRTPLTPSFSSSGLLTANAAATDSDDDSDNSTSTLVSDTDLVFFHDDDTTSTSSSNGNGSASDVDVEYAYIENEDYLSSKRVASKLRRARSLSTRHRPQRGSKKRASTVKPHTRMKRYRNSGGNLSVVSGHVLDHQLDPLKERHHRRAHSLKSVVETPPPRLNPLLGGDYSFRKSSHNAETPEDIHLPDKNASDKNDTPSWMFLPNSSPSISAVSEGVWEAERAPKVSGVNDSYADLGIESDEDMMSGIQTFDLSRTEKFSSSRKLRFTSFSSDENADFARADTPTQSVRKRRPGVQQKLPKLSIDSHTGFGAIRTLAVDPHATEDAPNSMVTPPHSHSHRRSATDRWTGGGGRRRTMSLRVRTADSLRSPIELLSRARRDDSRKDKPRFGFEDTDSSNKTNDSDHEASDSDHEEAVENQKKQYSPMNMSRRRLVAELDADAPPNSPSARPLKFLEDPMSFSRKSSVSDLTEDLLGCVRQKSGGLVLQDIATLTEKGASTSKRPPVKSGETVASKDQPRDTENEATSIKNDKLLRVTRPVNPLSPLHHLSGGDNTQAPATQDFGTKAATSVPGPLSARGGFTSADIALTLATTVTNVDPSSSTSKSVTSAETAPVSAHEASPLPSPISAHEASLLSSPVSAHEELLLSSPISAHEASLLSSPISAHEALLLSSPMSKRPSQMDEADCAANGGGGSGSDSGACTPGSFDGGRRNSLSAEMMKYYLGNNVDPSSSTSKSATSAETAPISAHEASLLSSPVSAHEASLLSSPISTHEASLRSSPISAHEASLLSSPNGGGDSDSGACTPGSFDGGRRNSLSVEMMKYYLG